MIKALPVALTFAFTVAAFGSPAEANMGLPMLAAVWPKTWLLLVPIIYFEAYLAENILHVSSALAGKIAVVGNLTSTLIGIPIAWVLLVIAQVVVGAGRASGIETLPKRIYAVTVQSPWLLPYPGQDNWMVPAAEFVLCFPFCLMSIWTEYASVAYFLPGRVPPIELLEWAWIANLSSYFLLACMCLVWLVIAIEIRRKELKRDKEKVYPPLRVVRDDEQVEE